MNDEKYTFIQDIKEKKITARGSHNRRTHAGKGGAVKFPSDYLSKKELRAMSSETKIYKMNEPISWAEFKAMPDDLKKQYLTNLREKYNVAFSDIGLMFGISSYCINNEARRLKIATGKRGKSKNLDRKDWEAFIHSNAAKIPVVDETASAEVSCNTPEPLKNQLTTAFEVKKSIPLSGSMRFSGSAKNALETMIAILGGGGSRNYCNLAPRNTRFFRVQRGC